MSCEKRGQEIGETIVKDFKRLKSHNKNKPKNVFKRCVQSSMMGLWNKTNKQTKKQNEVYDKMLFM